MNHIHIISEFNLYRLHSHDLLLLCLALDMFHSLRVVKVSGCFEKLNLCRNACLPTTYAHNWTLNSFFSKPHIQYCRTLWTSRVSSQIEIRKQNSEVSPSTRKEKTKKAVKDTSYGLVVVVGLACIGTVFYVLYRELLSKSGPTKIFSDALEKCRSDQSIQVALGAPIEGYGETSSRGRRRHVTHLAYIDSQGRDAMRMKFYVKGSTGRTGTVQVDAVIVGRKISYRYLIAYLDLYPPRTIILVDERSMLDAGIESLEVH